VTAAAVAAARRSRGEDVQGSAVTDAAAGSVRAGMERVGKGSTKRPAGVEETSAAGRNPPVAWSLMS
jgi:tRNA U34 5-methylaminomethyl-2-thiouridine-forming methyltransferase MnmC